MPRNEWLEDFRARCGEQGVDFHKVMRAAGYSDTEIGILKRRKSPAPLDKLILERELISYGTPQPLKLEPEKVEEPKPKPNPKPRPLICTGKDCPYLVHVGGNKGFCPLPRCVMQWRKDADDKA